MELLQIEEEGARTPAGAAGAATPAVVARQVGPLGAGARHAGAPRRVPLAHGVRGGPLPQPGRVLDPGDGHLHAAGRHLHAQLRLLRRDHRKARSARPGGAATRGRGEPAARPHVRGRDVGGPGRPRGRWGRALCRHGPRHSRIESRGAGRGAGSGLQGEPREHPQRGREPADRLQPQPGDGGAAVQEGPGAGPLPSLAGGPADRQRAGTAHHQDRDHAGPGRNPGRGRGADAGCPRGGM